MNKSRFYGKAISRWAAKNFEKGNPEDFINFSDILDLFEPYRTNEMNGMGVPARTVFKTISEIQQVTPNEELQRFEGLRIKEQKPIEWPEVPRKTPEQAEMEMRFLDFIMSLPKHQKEFTAKAFAEHTTNYLMSGRWVAGYRPISMKDAERFLKNHPPCRYDKTTKRYTYIA